MKHTRKRRSNISREFRLPANVMHEEAWEDSGPNMKLSRAFIVVLVLHIVAVGGLAAFNLFDSKKPKDGSEVALPEKPLVPVAKNPNVETVQPTIVQQTPAVQISSTKPVKVENEMSTHYFALQYGLTEPELLKANEHQSLASGNLMRGQTVFVPSGAMRRSSVDDLPEAPVVAVPQEEVAVAVATPAVSQPKPRETYVPPKKTWKAPAKKTTPKKTTTRTTGSRGSYRVKKGDTLYSIARKYKGVSHSDIMRANGIGTTIKPGQTLKIPR